MNNQQTLAIAAIFKNEGPYILEWIAFHRIIGVNHFFIADNESTDGSTELLQALDALGIITYIPFPSIPGGSPQLPAYRKILKDHSTKFQWFAFIDADEFLTPTNGEASIKPALQSIAKDNTIGAIAVNWAIYGSSHRKNYSPELVIERFTYRATQKFGVNKHYKSIVRSNLFLDAHENPHAFKIADDLSYAHANGHKMTQDESKILGLSQEVCWEPFRINHYIVKSFEEFTLKKNRGRATTPASAGLNRTDSFFRGHDRNDEPENMPPHTIHLVKDEINKLKHKLITSGASEKTVEISFPKTSKFTGILDYGKVIDSYLEFSGWAFFEDNAPITFCLEINNHIFSTTATIKTDRPDVKSKIQNAPIDCGFKILISMSDIPKNLLDKDLYINATTTGVSYRIPFGKTYQSPLTNAIE